MKLSRRDFVKAAGAIGSLTVFGVGYVGTLKGIAKGRWAADEPRNPISGNAPDPEVRIDRETGKVTPNLDQYVGNTVCVGCTSLCGVRVRVDKQIGKVLRVAGNPYHPLYPRIRSCPTKRPSRIATVPSADTRIRASRTAPPLAAAVTLSWTSFTIHTGC